MMAYRHLIHISLVWAITVIVSLAGGAHAGISNLESMIDDRDALVVMNDKGNIILSKNASNRLIPASTLKILTALSAFHYLGDNYRFKTEFFIDNNSNLVVKGYGDPLFISEVISSCCEKIKPIISQNSNTLNDIIIDHSYFESIDIPGVSGSSEPYDAPVGALCANFNTVAFSHDSRGRIVSDEKQTPLLPFLITRINQSGLHTGRIILNTNERDLYVGYLLKYFLEKQGIIVKGKIRVDRTLRKEDRKIYVFESPFDIQDVVKKLLDFSNNFIANQLLVSIGAKIYGEPGNLEKGIRAVKQYSDTRLGLKDYTLAEGSGLSRKNRISAYDMAKLVRMFVDHRSLMRTRNNVNFKTGTLTGISTRVGYLTTPSGRMYSFVIFCNTPGKSAENIQRKLYDMLSLNKITTDERKIN